MFQIVPAQFSSVRLGLRLNTSLRTIMKEYECTWSSTISNHNWTWFSWIIKYIIITKVYHTGWWIWLMSVTTNETRRVYILYQMIKRLLNRTESQMKTELNWAIWNKSNITILRIINSNKARKSWDIWLIAISFWLYHLGKVCAEEIARNSAATNAYFNLYWTIWDINNNCTSRDRSRIILSLSAHKCCRSTGLIPFYQIIFQIPSDTLTCL